MTWQVLAGDVRVRLAELPAASVQCVVTSPPYFGLRSYLHASDPDKSLEVGCEPTPAAYVETLVGVFREVRRVLRDDATVFLNLGDSYNAYNGNRGASTSFQSATEEANPKLDGGYGLTCKTLKNKDLIGIPWRVAFALQADGWWLRQDLIWHKPNPMPESVTDRCTKAHEYVFLLTKSARYFWDAAAIAEPSSVDYGSLEAYRERIGAKRYEDGNSDPKGGGFRGSGGFARTAETFGTRNARSVWTIATQPYPGAHFAVMPEALAERCVLAGSRMGDLVLDPFSGAGTVGVSALNHGRSYIGIELNPAYVEMSRKRLAGVCPMFAEEVVA